MATEISSEPAAVTDRSAEVLASLTSPRPITLNVGVGAYSDALIRVGDDYQVRRPRGESRALRRVSPCPRPLHSQPPSAAEGRQHCATTPVP